MNREQIISEIRRTAKANGGVPLGRGKFSTETGIKVTEWYCKFWIRWGDALEEAGFAPNRMNEAYQTDEIIEKLIALTRELGRFPVIGDIRMKARQDPGFPSHTVFTRQGSKQELLSKVLKFCKEHPGFDDIIPRCEESSKADKLSNQNEVANVEVDGFVYLLKSGKYHKIGKSNSWGRRERELSLLLPQKANIVHFIRTDDPSGIEDYWHRRFQPQRKNGEWFELRSEQVRAFKRRKFM
jgi:hypothetical protein